MIRVVGFPRHGVQICTSTERGFDSAGCDAADLTQQACFARLRDAADPAEVAGFAYRAEVAELADARGSGPRTRKGVGVRVPSSAPNILKSMSYRRGVHHGVHRTAGLVSIVVSTSPRSF